MTEPLHHIERGMLPWQTHRLTECKLDPTSVPTWTRDEAAAEHKKLGEQRFSLFVCMTCYHTARRRATWEHDPAACMARHAGSEWGRHQKDEHALRFEAELRAIAALVEAHRSEFDETVEGLLNLTSLDAHRKARRSTRIKKGRL